MLDADAELTSPRKGCS